MVHREESGKPMIHALNTGDKNKKAYWTMSMKTFKIPNINNYESIS